MSGVFTDMLVLLTVFMVSSLGSGWMMHRLGYPIKDLTGGREAIILILMKIVLMTIWAIVLIVVLWFVGINPLHI